jgi:hypothetical protein
LDDQLESMLDKAIQLSGKNRSEIAWEALARQLKLIQFESLRSKIMPVAEAREYLTEEDIFEEVS